MNYFLLFSILLYSFLMLSLLRSKLSWISGSHSVVGAGLRPERFWFEEWSSSKFPGRSSKDGFICVYRVFNMTVGGSRIFRVRSVRIFTQGSGRPQKKGLLNEFTVGSNVSKQVRKVNLRNSGFSMCLRFMLRHFLAVVWCCVVSFGKTIDDSDGALWQGAEKTDLVRWFA